MIRIQKYICARLTIICLFYVYIKRLFLKKIEQKVIKTFISRFDFFGSFFPLRSLQELEQISENPHLIHMEGLCIRSLENLKIMSVMTKEIFLEYYVYRLLYM